MRELLRECVALKRRQRDDYEARTATVLLGEQLHRLERLPTLDHLLGRAAPASPVGKDETHRAQFVAAAQAAGLTVRKHHPKRYRIVRFYPKAS